MKVAHLSSVHPATDPRITVKECRALSAAGHDVQLICPHDKDDVVNGVSVTAVRRRKGRWSRVVLGTWDVFQAARRSRAEVFHFHDPELLPVGAALRLTGAAVIYDAHEDLPRQILAKPWLPPMVRRPIGVIAELAENALARLMSGIVAATPQIAKRFASHKTVTVQNFAIADELVVASARPYHERPNLFVYIGGIAEIRGAFEMVRAMEKVAPRLDARLILAGHTSDDGMIARLARTPGWDRVTFRGWLSRAEVAEQLASARAGLLLLHPTHNYLESWPVKAFEYMTAGLPLIVSDFPLWREMFGDVGCAMFVNPLDPAAIAAAMQWILEHPADAARMGALGRDAARARFNWQAESTKLLSLYDSLTPRTTGVLRTELRDA